MKEEENANYKKICCSEVIAYLLDGKEVVRTTNSNSYRYFLHKSLFGTKTLHRKDGDDCKWRESPDMRMDLFLNSRWYVIEKAKQ